MKHFKKNLLMWILLLSGILSCSSSSTPVVATRTASEDRATFLEWCGSAWDGVNLLLESDKTLVFPLDCDGGGTMDQSGSTISLSDCVVTGAAGTYEGNGTYSLTTSGSTVAHAWNQSLSAVESSSTVSFTSTGSMTFDTSAGRVAYDISATFDTGTHRFAGSITDNGNGTSDATLFISLGETTVLDCTFDNVDLSALTDEDITDACLDFEGTECSTASCTGDFECQLFAEDDLTDDYETDNTTCADSGCCALTTEVSSCATVACTKDFSCQDFSENDLTDEFETSNTVCSNGCCALSE